MKIAYVFDRPLPARQTDSEQALRTISALGRLGAHVSLVLPRTAGSAPSAAQLADHYQVKETFEVVTLGSPMRAWSTARKLWHAQAATSCPVVQAADVVYTRNFPSLFRFAPGKRPLAYETYRPWPSQFPMLRPAFRRAMRAPNFLGAILHSRFARDKYAALGIAGERLLVAHNGHDPALFAGKPGREALRQKLGLPLEPPLVVYTGHINLTKGLDTVMEMARRLPNVHFALVGSDGQGVVEALAARFPNIHIIPWQPFAVVAEYLLAADVLLQPPSRVPLKLIGNTVLPMKLFLYLAAGKPIVAPDLPDMRELLDHEQNALLVAPGDAASSAQSIQRLIDDPSLSERLATAALEKSAGLTWDARAAAVLGFLDRQLGAQSVRTRADAIGPRR